MIIPLTAGMDAMRQMLFRTEGLYPFEYEVGLLAVLAVIFVALAARMLAVIERKAREQGTLTTKWQ
jgi:ABC-2 type transport system permease protein